MGRFQPPHQGHITCIRAAQEAADEVVIVVGSAQRSHTVRDPFTAGERLEMLHLALRDAGLDAAYLVPVPDLDQYHLWVAHVRSQVPAFDVVVTGSPMTERLFLDAGCEVIRIDPVARERLQGTELRRRWFAGAPIDDAVSPGVAAFLGQRPLQDRMRALAEAAEGTRG